MHSKHPTVAQLPDDGEDNEDSQPRTGWMLRESQHRMKVWMVAKEQQSTTPKEKEVLSNVPHSPEATQPGKDQTLEQHHSVRVEQVSTLGNVCIQMMGTPSKSQEENNAEGYKLNKAAKKEECEERQRILPLSKQSGNMGGEAYQVLAQKDGHNHQQDTSNHEAMQKGEKRACVAPQLRHDQAAAFQNATAPQAIASGNGSFCTRCNMNAAMQMLSGIPMDMGVLEFCGNPSIQRNTPHMHKPGGGGSNQQRLSVY